jgi:recombination protein RecA
MRTKTKSLAQQMKDRDRSLPTPAKVKHLSTGSTLLNLGVSDQVFGGFGLGKIVNIIGDSSSGKTTLAWSLLAEAAHKKRFDNHVLIYDDVEAACEHDVVKLFGQVTADRVRPPRGTREEPRGSSTVEEFQLSIHSYLKKGKPFVYILDSLDALTSDDEEERMEAKVKAYEKGTKPKGSYGMAKPKAMSEMLRQIVRKLRDSDSLLVIISQTRDNINPMSFTPKTRSGGRALEFYASHILWTAVAGKIKKLEQAIGIICRVKSTKSKLTGKIRTVEFPIYYDLGVDNTASCVDFLVEQGWWKKAGNKIKSSLVHKPMFRDRLVEAIEKEEKEKELKIQVGKCWQKMEDALRLNRRNRYA